MRSLSTLVCVLLSVCAVGSAEAQSIRLSGSLTDGPRKPMVFTDVMAFDGDGRALLDRPTIASARGQYSFTAKAPIAALIFVDDRDYRFVRIEGPWSDDARVDVDFSRIRMFTVRAAHHRLGTVEGERHGRYPAARRVLKQRADARSGLHRNY